MMDRFRGWLLTQLRAAKPSFISRSPHFNFISAHYFWVIGMTIFASILIFATAGGQLAYIDALFFASGANTQAGLNTVDVNRLNTFQQVCIYIFTMTSNPITINSFVVFLRLYWFEKHFQDLVREARSRRATFTKTKSKNKGVLDGSRAERGVADRNIRLMPNSGTRITNDGIVLEKAQTDGRVSPGSNGTAVPSSEQEETAQNGSAKRAGQSTADEPHPTQISFARTVTRSDGLDSDRLKLPERRPRAGSFLRLSRQRDAGEEILRIPNPRDVERGIKPKRLEEGDAPEVDEDEDEDQPGIRSAAPTRPNSPPGSPRFRDGRQPTITIALPKRPDQRPEMNGKVDKSDRSDKSDSRPASRRDAMDELTDGATAFGNVLGLFKLRKPRIFQRGNKTHHVDSDDEDDLPPTHLRRRKTFDAIKGALGRDKNEEAPYLSWTPTLGRNSQFPGLTIEQREELGGIEYRSLRTLAIILFCYFWGFTLFAALVLVPWIHSGANQQYAQVVNDAGMSKTWWGFFTANSAFLDLGLTLTPDSMNSFNSSQYVLMMMAFLIIVGNTGFPVMLRCIIWVLVRITPRHTGLWEELQFLLDHPRRCFTLLFPAGATWWLFWILIGLNALDLVFFVALDLNEPVVSDLPVHLRVVNGLFQAACTRTAGFSSVNISLLHPAVQVSYMMMMYISVFPIAISIRRTNVYEEKSLGVYQNAEDEEDGFNENSGMSYVGSHLRRQLSFDLWYVFLGLFVLCITEGGRIKSNDFNVYNILFEIISAYGTVGLSQGYTGANYSLSGEFSTLGKLVIIAMQIRGRHRGLPYGLDRAVLLPSAKRFEEETLAASSTLARQTTQATFRTTTATASGVDAGLRRGRSRDRGIITSFLHPGPPVSRMDRVISRRDSRRISVDFDLDSLQGDDLTRRNTEPADDDTGSMASQSRVHTRRVYTTPVG